MISNKGDGVFVNGLAGALHFDVVGDCGVDSSLIKALKTYNQYHTDCMAAEGKLKEAERLEERHTGKSADLSLGQSTGPRRSSVKKIERLMEKVEMCVYGVVVWCVYVCVYDVVVWCVCVCVCVCV